MLITGTFYIVKQSVNCLMNFTDKYKTFVSYENKYTGLINKNYKIKNT